MAHMTRKDKRPPMTRIEIFLYTNAGVHLFDGHRTQYVYSTGVYRYAKKIKEAWLDAQKGCLMANYFLLQVEEKIKVCEEILCEQTKILEQKRMCDSQQVKQRLMTESQKRSIISIAPYPYMVASLVVTADACITNSLILGHRGIITEIQTQSIKQRVIKSVRRMLEHANLYIELEKASSDILLGEKLKTRLGRIPYEVSQGLILPHFGPRRNPTTSSS